MSNVLKVSHQEAIKSLHRKGWSWRRIARELGINRRTARRYARTKLADPTPGPAEACESKCTISTPGSGEGSGPKCGTDSPPGHSGRKSRCEPLAGPIAGKVEAGLSAQRIYQDLVEESGFEGSYQSVKRFVRRLKAAGPGRVQRMECQPGEEMQVDFGLGVPLVGAEGKPRRTWVLRVVLSYSRKGYSEGVLRQDTETFLRCLENAVRHFGGVPLVVNLDNLKAAVLRADWFDPEINPKLADFCRHYGIGVMPCRPRTPQHKGKVERGVGYVRNNALKGRRFAALAEMNLHLSRWEEGVADKRIHGTTCKQVGALFGEERSHLQPLPASLFPCYQEARRRVGRDSFVEVAKSYYEVPPEYVGRQVWARWDARAVRVFNERMEQVQVHARIEPGRFSRCLGAAGMSRPVLSSCRYWAGRAAMLGEHCGRWAQSALDARGPGALRSIMGLCHLAPKHSASAIDAACAKAAAAGARRLKDVARLIGAGEGQRAFAFAESHPLIRDLKIYADFLGGQQTDHRPESRNDHDTQQHEAIRPHPEALGVA